VVKVLSCLKEWHRKSEKYPALKRNRPSHGVDGLHDGQGGGENLSAITREKQIIKPITGVEIYITKTPHDDAITKISVSSMRDYTGFLHTLWEMYRLIISYISIPPRRLFRYDYALLCAYPGKFFINYTNRA